MKYFSIRRIFPSKQTSSTVSETTSKRRKLRLKTFCSPCSQEAVSTLTFQLSLFNFRFASFLKIVPFQLRENGKLNVEAYGKQWKVCLWYIVNALVLLSSVYQIGSFCKSVWIYGFTSETAVRLFYFFMALMPILFLTPTLLMPMKAVNVINQLEFLGGISESKGHPSETKQVSVNETMMLWSDFQVAVYVHRSGIPCHFAYLQSIT